MKEYIIIRATEDVKFKINRISNTDCIEASRSTSNYETAVAEAKKIAMDEDVGVYVLSLEKLLRVECKTTKLG